MAFENMDMETESEPLGTPPEESSNRSFYIVLGVLGAITLLVLLCVVGYMLIVRPRLKNQQQAQIDARNAQNTQVAMAITQTSAAIAITATPTNTSTPVPNTPTAAATQPGVVVVPTATRQATADPRTATVAALLTQAASVATRTTGPVAPSPTALPKTGFAEDVGLPMMIGLAALLIVVIFLARRLRTA
jgi:LPXTG-motif cell wall-anchored protein